MNLSWFSVNTNGNVKVWIQDNKNFWFKLSNWCQFHNSSSTTNITSQHINFHTRTMQAQLAVKPSLWIQTPKALSFVQVEKQSNFSELFIWHRAKTAYLCRSLIFGNLLSSHIHIHFPCVTSLEYLQRKFNELLCKYAVLIFNAVCLLVKRMNQYP